MEFASAIQILYLQGSPADVRRPQSEYLQSGATASPVTAHDFVYSWRRLVDPATAAPMAFYLAPVVNAEEVTKGAKPPSMLAVRAIDDFTFEFELVAPISVLRKLLWQPLLAAVPRLSIEAGRQHGREAAWSGRVLLSRVGPSCCGSGRRTIVS